MFDKFDRLPQPNERKRLHCNECETATIHSLEAQCTGRWSDEVVNGGEDYSIYKCGACDSVCFESSGWNSEWMDYDNDGNAYHPTEDKQYPTPISKDFNFNTEHTPHRLDELIEEMLFCYGGNKYISATMMLRMVVEFIVKDIKCKGKDLVNKIKDLKERGLVDQDQHDLLQKIREHGNKSAHGAIAISQRQLLAAMSVVSLLIESQYNAPGRQKAIIEKAKKDL